MRSSLLQKLQTWSKAILNQSKLRTYILFKTDYCAENYVTANLTRPKRSVIAQLRTGILPLNIDLMRYGQFHKPEDRLCSLCKEIEDEKYFVFDCQRYVDIRLNFYKSINWNVNTFNDIKIADKWNQLMNTKNVYKFSKYLLQILQIRKNI